MLEFDNVSHVYADGTRALDGVSLSVGPGLFGLLGPNGAGKSTLMRLVATLQAPSTGRIRFDGIDVVAQPRAIRRMLGYLPQDFGVYPRTSAYDLLDQIAVLKGLSRKAERQDTVELLLQRTNLWSVRKRDVASFSGGMRRRFGIAQALIGNPRLLVVDEPTAGLDPDERNRLHELLADVGDSATVILSTHIVEDVENLCSRMAVLAAGRILVDGDPSELGAGLRGRLWTTTVGRHDPLPPDVLSTRLVGGMRRIHLIASAAPSGDYRAVAPTLEDVYFAALQRA